MPPKKPKVEAAGGGKMNAAEQEAMHAEQSQQRAQVAAAWRAAALRGEEDNHQVGIDAAALSGDGSSGGVVGALILAPSTNSHGMSDLLLEVLDPMTLNLSESMASILQRADYERINMLVYERTDELRNMPEAYLHHQLHVQKTDAFWPQLMHVVEDSLLQYSTMEAAAVASGGVAELMETVAGAELGVASAQAAALPIGGNISRVLFVNAGAGYPYAREECITRFGLDEIYGVNDLDITQYRQVYKNRQLDAAWVKVPAGSHLYADTENLQAVYESMGDQEGDRGTLSVLVEACNNLAGFKDRAASSLRVGRPGDVIISVQRIGNGVDDYSLLQAEAFLDEGCWYLHAVPEPSLIGQGLYQFVVLTYKDPEGNEDDGRAKLGLGVGRDLASVLAAAERHDKDTQGAVGLVYACGTFGCDMSKLTAREEPRLTLTDAQRAWLPANSVHRMTGDWLWEYLLYVGRVCRFLMTANAMGKKRGGEHLEKKGILHHSWRLGAKLLDLVEVGAVDIADPYPNWNDVVFPDGVYTLPLWGKHGGQEGLMDIIGGVKRFPGEEPVFFDVRLAGEEQQAITQAKEKGMLLNTLTVAGCFNSFARQQEGYQGAKAFGLKKVKELMVDGTTAEQLSGKIHPLLEQALLVEGGAFLMEWVSQRVDGKEAAEMQAMAASAAPLVAELKERWASMDARAKAQVVASMTVDDPIDVRATREERAPAAPPTRTAPFVMARVLAAKAKEAAALAAALERAGEREALAGVATAIVKEKGRLMGVRWNTRTKKWAAEAAREGTHALSVHAPTRELAGEYVDVVNRCGTGPTATCNFTFAGVPLEPYKSNERAITQGTFPNMPARDKLIVRMGIFSKSQLMTYGERQEVVALSVLGPDMGSGKVKMGVLEAYCRKRKRGGATEGRMNEEITPEMHQAAMAVYHEIQAAEEAGVGGGEGGGDGMEMEQED